MVSFLLANAVGTGVGDGPFVSCSSMSPSPVIDAYERSVNDQVVRQMEHWAFSQSCLQSLKSIIAFRCPVYFLWSDLMTNMVTVCLMSHADK